MKLIIQYTFRISLLVGLVFWALPGFAQLGRDDYTVARRAEFSLNGQTRSYQYLVDRLEGRFNHRLKRFEFRFPIEAVQPTRSPLDLSIFKLIFMNSPDAVINPDDIVQLWVYVPNDMRNFDDFRNAKTITLPADLVINGTVYRTPVAMNLFYSAGSLKYGIDMNINMSPGFETLTAANFVGGPLRNLQMLVPESEMNVFFNQ